MLGRAGTSDGRSFARVRQCQEGAPVVARWRADGSVRREPSRRFSGSAHRPTGYQGISGSPPTRPTAPRAAVTGGRRASPV
ncbi:hypothetical protein SCATT_09730 [Streptantibioticus cattleyicolor NRRL 8057 = DSM 46488]|uniref:Uncharacterized protein n=1 Tax=Streptantibioticus cattleyicolor (strain ATCC 35852 / DSM 46488 / JCM 4925 / NBRC 14057 / NRRL 8057) TaxID=1003195 RepID=G8WN61_STREN|nr:hypothetical protein SCATT_09730 [Streptantibioticus cattleyicolor NRRL 8057 = DSM 46488]